MQVYLAGFKRMEICHFLEVSTTAVDYLGRLEGFGRGVLLPNTSRPETKTTFFPFIIAMRGSGSSVCIGTD